MPWAGRLDGGSATVGSWFGLDGQVAIVTGAGAGIGRDVAQTLAAAGARIAALERDAGLAEATVDAIKAAGGTGLAIDVDVTDFDAVAKGIERTVEEFGRLDILVSNAGIYPPFGRLPEIDWDKYTRTIDVNLHAVMRAMTLAAPFMQPGGRITNMSSMESIRPSGPSTSHYSVSKAAVNGLTRAGAVDLAPLGIRVNAVLPGIVRTEGTSALPEDMINAIAAKAPCSRIGMPADISGAVLFLASQAASYVNGHCLVVDGGTTIQG